MAIPGETARPDNLCSALRHCGPTPVSGSVLIEFAFDQLGESCDRRLGFASGGSELDDRPRRGRQHHQSHDRAAGDFGAVLPYPDLGIELPRGFDEAGGSAGMEPLLVANRRAPANKAGRRLRFTNKPLIHWFSAHRRASVSSCEATLIYFRPASCAPRTVRSRLSLCRRLASLISIGRLTPATTSILARSITEIARLDGVPPNMSVSNTAPSPVSTAAIERRISCRRSSMSSSGPMQTATICVCAPTTCSSAATNSAASRPWVTKTMPIIGFLCRTTYWLQLVRICALAGSGAGKPDRARSRYNNSTRHPMARNSAAKLRC